MKLYALRDLHGTPVGEVPPEADVVILAGDLCVDRMEHQDTRLVTTARKSPDSQLRWFKQQTFPPGCVGTWGNHDFCGETPSAASIPWMYIDEALFVGGKRAWFSPWSRKFNHWAFMKTEEELRQTYANIPLGTEILVSHQPPFGCCDGPEHLGSPALRQVIELIQPTVVICGHIHEGFGEGMIGKTRVYNVACLNRHYDRVRNGTMIEV